jgi:hypothetical protein
MTRRVTNLKSAEPLAFPCQSSAFPGQGVALIYGQLCGCLIRADWSFSSAPRPACVSPSLVFQARPRRHIRLSRDAIVVLGDRILDLTGKLA